METDHVGRFLNPDGGYLDINGFPITGCTSYKGITAMQHDAAFSTFESLLKTIRPSRVLEIGTAAGGLCLFIRQVLNDIGLENTPIKTFDIYDCSTHRVLEQQNNTEVIYENLFSKDYIQLEKPELIEDYIKSEGVTLVLCDGGNKITEFKTIAPLIKPGDVIMAHDYAPNIDFFKDNIMNKIWCWMEIQDSDISETCEDNNLESFMSNDFEKVVWVCKKKV